MPSVMAIVSKAVFERDARTADGKQVGVGDRWLTDSYHSKHKRLNPLTAAEQAGSLFLVTVRPPDEQLWLVAILEKPSFGGVCWTGPINNTPVVDITSLKSRLTFDTGKGISAKKGALGMSLQTPRALTNTDEILLRTAAAGEVSTPPTPDEHKAQPQQPAAPAGEPPPETSSADPGLANALQLLSEHHPINALETLIAVWGRTPSAELAEVIERLGAWIDRGLPSIEGKAKTPALDEAWIDVAGARQLRDVGRLLAVLGSASTPMLRRWIEALNDFPIDPRLPAPVLRASCAFTAHEAGRTRTAAFKLARRVGDRRVTRLLEELSHHVKPHIADPVKRLLAELSGSPPHLPTQDQPKVVTLGELINALEGGGPWTEQQLLDSVLPDEKAAAEQALLAETYEDPAADDPRLVYADWLLERGDPRGELIMLQFERHEKGKLGARAAKREQLLIREHGRAWIRPLDAVVSNARFSRGFLSGGAVLFQTDRQRRELASCEVWKTVEELDSCNDESFLLEPVLCSLQRAPFSAATLAALSQVARPVPLRHASSAFVDLARIDLDQEVGWKRRIWGGGGEFAREIERIRPMELSHWQVVCQVGALRNLTGLSLAPAHHYYARQCGDIGPYRWLIDSKLGGQLRKLELDCDDTIVPLRQWINTLEKGKLPRLERLQLRCAPDDYYDSPNYNYPKRPCNLVFELRRDSKGTLSLSLTVDWPIHRNELRPISPLLTRAVADIDPGKLSDVTLCYSGNKRSVDLDRLAEVEAILTPFFSRVIRS